MLKKFFLFAIFFVFLLFSICYLLHNPKTRSTVSPFIKFLSPTPITQTQATLIAVGDIMLGRNVNVKMHKYQNFLYPFEKTASFLSLADITFGNLESPFFDNCPIVGSGTMKFCADYKAVEGLKFAGFDVLSLENNHIGNYGQVGINQTIELLEKNEISPSTSDQLVIKKIKNITFGFLSWNLTILGDQNKGAILKKIEEASKEIDILVVSFHWGEEYQPKPATWQIELAHQAIDAGAKIILGHHSHVIGEIEQYKGGLIFYSLGNFVFDQMWSTQTRKGLAVKINFESKKIKDFQTYQVLISDYSQPDFLISE